jgi:hypothetical protein
MTAEIEPGEDFLEVTERLRQAILEKLYPSPDEF